eukprot:SAG11_NODE_5777_length_1465_cov_12.692533_2_plen_63_part_00
MKIHVYNIKFSMIVYIYISENRKFCTSTTPNVRIPRGKKKYNPKTTSRVQFGSFYNVVEAII